MYLHLTQLKQRILSAESVGATRFDDILTGIAEGVSGAFDRFCGRSLMRAVDCIEEFPADSAVLFLERYPVETLTTLEYRADEGDDFSTLEYTRLSKQAGLINLYTTAGEFDGTIRATYTAGYWVDTSADLDGTLPSGAVALPKEVIDAWCAQVDYEARVRKAYGVGKDGDVNEAYEEDVELLPRVQRVLRSFQRIF